MDKWLKYGCMKYIDAVRLYEISEIRIYENRKGMKFGQNTRITDLLAKNVRCGYTKTDQ